MNRKKLIAFGASLSLLGCLLSFNAAAEDQQIKVEVDSQQMTFTDQQPVMKNDRVMVPMRAIFEYLGALVDWKSETETVTAKKGDIRVSLKIGSTAVKKNNTDMTLDVPAQVINDRTMVPLRFVSEALGAQVVWSEAKNTAEIYTNNPEVTISSDEMELGDEVLKVVSPENCANIKGDTKISFKAPGLASVTVKCWKSGELGGEDSIVGTVTPDANGDGSVVFPADNYPQGPLCIRLMGSDGTKIRDQLYWQVYNTGGVKWEQGIPSVVPSAATGMKLVFEDDFNTMPKISNNGKDAIYNAHKPGGGDFSKLLFSNPEGEGNPFSQVDSFLRIRARTSTNTSGLLSSLRANGTGITASLPCYFECRFIAPSAPGCWPAFWLMTKDAYMGSKKPEDELDAIEAYGLTNMETNKLKARNVKSYSATSHAWNQTEPPLGRLSKPVDQFSMGSGSAWYMSPHVYGIKIGETETVYYCDNMEVGRHPTLKISKEQPFFFMINLAVGGNGWSVDLSRYNGVVDMYVDYVRVFADKLPDPNTVKDLDMIPSGANIDVPAGFSTYGVWKESGLKGANADIKTYYTSAIDSYAFWNPDIKEPCKVKVSVYKLGHESSRKQKYEIYHDGKVNTKVIDFYGSESGWTEMGTYDFSAKGKEYVKLSGEGEMMRIAEMKFDILSGKDAGKSIVIEQKEP